MDHSLASAILEFYGLVSRQIISYGVAVGQGDVRDSLSRGWKYSKGLMLGGGGGGWKANNGIQGKNHPLQHTTEKVGVERQRNQYFSTGWNGILSVFTFSY